MSKSAQIRLLLALICLVLLIIVGVQNSGPVEIKLLFWNVFVDRALLFLLLLVIGVVGGMIFSWSLNRNRKPESEQS